MAEMKEKRELMDAETTARVLKRMAYEIMEQNSGAENIVLIGIQRKGVYLAKKIAQLLETAEGKSVPVGSLDITFYRDDLTMLSEHPVIQGTDIPFSVQNMNIILVDDVLYSGRTIRAAIDELFDMGRPAKVQLAVFVDRGHREVPIRADFVGRNVPTSGYEYVNVEITAAGEIGRTTLLTKEN